MAPRPSLQQLWRRVGCHCEQEPKYRSETGASRLEGKPDAPGLQRVTQHLRERKKLTVPPKFRAESHQLVASSRQGSGREALSPLLLRISKELLPLLGICGGNAYPTIHFSNTPKNPIGATPHWRRRRRRQRADNPQATTVTDFRIQTKDLPRGCLSGSLAGYPRLSGYFETDSHSSSCCKSDEHFKAESLPFASCKV